jgi:hypothetical protein
MYFIDQGVVADLDDMRRFPLGDDDLLVVGFPKSGTSWLQIMITNLWDDWKTCGGTLRKVPSLHGRNTSEGKYYGFADALALESPRLMKTHLPYELFPERWPVHGKVVHITRNPKDVCVSLFHELRHMNRTDPNAQAQVDDFDTMVTRFLAGQVPWGPYVDNNLGWHRIEHPNLLKITYEEARSDTRKVLQTVVDFVDRPVTSERIDEVVAKTEFKAMQSSDVRLQINHPDLREDSSAPFMRKGIVGDWKEVFSVAQNEAFDRQIVQVLEENGLHLTYE